MVPSERRSGTNSTRVTWTTLTPVPEAQIKNAYESYATTLASMDGDAARDRVWAGATEFQRLVGREAKSGQLYEQDGVVASVVRGVGRVDRPCERWGRRRAEPSRPRPRLVPGPHGGRAERRRPEPARRAGTPRRPRGPWRRQRHRLRPPAAGRTGLCGPSPARDLCDGRPPRRRARRRDDGPRRRRRRAFVTFVAASKLGQGIYARLGYRPLGEQHLWELRP